MEINRVGTDQYSVGNSRPVDLQTLLMTLQMERAENLEKQLTDQANQMKQINDQLKLANQMMADARSLKITAGNASNKVSTMPNSMASFYNDNGIKYDMTGNDKLHNKDEWEVNIQNLKGYMDGLNSDSQMEMILLQSLMNKRNQSYEMMTQTLQKLSGVTDKIIGNIR